MRLYSPFLKLYSCIVILILAGCVSQPASAVPVYPTPLTPVVQLSPSLQPTMVLSSAETAVPAVSVLPTLGPEWSTVDSAPGAILAQSGNNFLAVADLRYARVVFTGSNSKLPIDSHWDELATLGTPFFVTNGCLFEPDGRCSFPYVKGNTEWSSGPMMEDDQYKDNLRFLVLEDGLATIRQKSDWYAGYRASDMLAGFDTDIGKRYVYRTLIGVSSEGGLFYILQFQGTTADGVNILTSLNTGLTTERLILLDGGESTQGRYRAGYTRKTTRPVVNGIGLILK